MIAKITDKERKHYDQIISTTCPIDALLNRVILVQVREEDELVDTMSIPGLEGRDIVRVGGLFIPKEAKESLRENEVVKAVVKSVGPTRDGRKPAVKVNDLVLVFPNTFETMIKIEGLDYFVYGESDMVALVATSQNEDIYCTKGMD